MRPWWTRERAPHEDKTPRGPIWRAFTGVLRWTFLRSQPQISPFQVVAWWELRRIPYNIIVGGAGLVSFVLYFFFLTWSGELQEGEDAVEPMALMLAPFLINFCYTAGWVVELSLMAIRRHRVWMGPALLILGTLFSLCAVAAPAVLWGVIWLLGTLRAV